MFQQTDEIVWRFCLQGDQKAFEELYKRYYALLYNYGKKIVPDVELVRDCLQNFFIKLIRNYETLSQTASVKGYMLKAFRYTLYNALKSENERVDLIATFSDESLSLFSEETFDSEIEDIPESYLAIYESFCLLSSRQQEILYLYYVLELSHADIAEALNINYQSSKNLLFRSLARLKELYFELQGAQLKTLSQKLEGVSVFSRLEEDFRYFRVGLAK